jgi:NADH:ubiquinone oxidoreductase subunit 6 (subunit J)
MLISARSRRVEWKEEVTVIFQIISIAGAVLILTAFGANQLDRMKRETIAYQLLNFIGGVCLCITAVHTMQYGFIMLEGTWSVLSLIGLVKVMRTKEAAS